jgi:nitrite reductase/ring-hydroxylating ferredoxin subunit
MTAKYQRVLKELDVADNTSVSFLINGWPVFIAKSEGEFFALINKCTHANSEFDGGRIYRGAVTCPLHGTRFELSTGKCRGGAYRPLKTFDLRRVDGWIEVAVPDAKPGLEHMPIRVY